MNLCVSDEYVIVNIQGIRNVTWGGHNANTHYATIHAAKPWFITVTYKGSHNIFYYQTEEAARSIFNKIREAMDKTVRN
jgi:hypothetical protein